MAYTLSSECCDCQEVYDNDLGPCDDCGGECEVTLSISNLDYACEEVDITVTPPGDGRANVIMLATVTASLPAGQTVASFQYISSINPPASSPGYVGWDGSGAGSQQIALDIPSYAGSLGDTMYVRIVTNMGEICESNTVTFDSNFSDLQNIGVWWESMTFSNTNYGGSDYDEGDTYYLPGGRSSGSAPEQVPGTVGAPVGCLAQCFTVTGDFLGAGDRLRIFYKLDRNDTGWQAGNIGPLQHGYYPTGGGFATGTFTATFHKPAGFAWMAFQLVEDIDSKAWNFTVTRNRANGIPVTTC
jgi:hypothetical protein